VDPRREDQGQKRSRKKKENGVGSLEDFTASRPRNIVQSLQELRERFEEDLAKVKR
jgi:hypothetical protein